MRRICILTQNHISKNPRVLKESILLASMGFQVKILTSWYSEELLQLDQQLIQSYPIQYFAYADLRPGMQQRLYHRLRFQISRRLNALGIESIDAGGYGPWNLLKLARQEAADFYIIHQEVPTLIAPQLLSDGYKIAYDFEDWYSRDLTVEARKYRPVKLLAKAERFGIQHGIWCTTTSYSLAKALALEAKDSQIPVVIYNGFSIKERENLSMSNIPAASKILRLAWISQTIGPGRGLEEFIEMAISLNLSIELNLAGSPRMDFINQMNQKVSQGTTISIVVHPYMPPTEILPWLNSFDGGIASDIANSPSRDYTITNKILHYLLAGIPVVASPTKGHQEIAHECPESVHILKEKDRLLEFLQSIHPLSPDRQKIRDQAWKDGNKFSWEVQAEKLKKLAAEKIN